ncbi:hypothetical protein BTUL_0046g00550 [Botrytis tulipae]|uniref:Uncharacterized protein n=1 Tax=Botrytis tulipae TaxID=87230 RepID=A0A4Z1ERB9_9HELO|nr:hypothetical protein BTUL_0046g00550 [Botrytis tulipae]
MDSGLNIEWHAHLLKKEVLFIQTFQEIGGYFSESSNVVRTISAEELVVAVHAQGGHVSFESMTGAKVAIHIS